MSLYWDQSVSLFPCLYHCSQIVLQISLCSSLESRTISFLLLRELGSCGQLLMAAQRCWGKWPQWATHTVLLHLKDYWCEGGRRGNFSHMRLSKVLNATKKLSILFEWSFVRSGYPKMWLCRTTWGSRGTFIDLFDVILSTLLNLK